MTFPDFLIIVSKRYSYPNWKKAQRLVYRFTTSNVEPDLDPIVFVIEPAVKNLIVW